MRGGLLLAGLALLPLACGGGGTSAGGDPGGGPVPAATPVRVAKVERTTLARVVDATGRTAALEQQKLRAPFTGTVTELRVVEGDRVTAGEEVGAVVSRDGEAALDGARQMLREATTESERRDAERAVELARKDLVRVPLSVKAAGLVLSREVSAGDRVGEGDEILTVAIGHSVVFTAEVAQSDLPSIHPGEAAVVQLSGRNGPLAGKVHGILSTADPAALTAPVRIDLEPPAADLALGLFGTARITVGEHRNVPVVPAAAVLRDDVSGVSRIATVDPQGKVHWVEVTPGLAQGGRVEITSPKLATGQTVIVSGQVGLPEGTAVVARP